MIRGVSTQPPEILCGPAFDPMEFKFGYNYRIETSLVWPCPLVRDGVGQQPGRALRRVILRAEKALDQDK